MSQTSVVVVLWPLGGQVARSLDRRHGVCWLIIIFVMILIIWASFCSDSLFSAIIVLCLIFFVFFEVRASIYYVLYVFYCCRAPYVLCIFVHTFVIVFCFYRSASYCKYAGTFVPS